MNKTLAVARHMVAEGIRMKISVVFIVLLLVILVGLPLTVRGDETVSGAIQTFLAYSLGTVGLVLSLLTIFMCRSLSDELVNRQIFLVLTKPVPRWQFLMGKWLGIMVINAALLLFTGVCVYVAVRYMASKSQPGSYDEQRVRNQVLTARARSSVKVPEAEIAARVNERFRKLQEEGRFSGGRPVDEAQVKAELAHEEEMKWRTIAVGSYRDFEFENVLVEPGSDAGLQIRYRAIAHPYPADEVLRALWIVGDRADANAYMLPQRNVIDRYHTLTVPTDAVSSDGTLHVRFINQNPFEGEQQFPNVVQFEAGDHLEVLFTVGTFHGNLLRLLSLMYLKLMFLAALGLCMASMFSFPVACLACLTVLALMGGHHFFFEAIDWTSRGDPRGVLAVLVRPVLSGLGYVLPSFSEYDALPDLVDGRNVSLTWVIRGTVRLGLSALAVGGFGAWIFHRRELAEVSI